MQFTRQMCLHFHTFTPPSLILIRNKMIFLTCQIHTLLRIWLIKRLRKVRNVMLRKEMCTGCKLASKQWMKRSVTIRYENVIFRVDFHSRNHKRYLVNVFFMNEQTSHTYKILNNTLTRYGHRDIHSFIPFLHTQKIHIKRWKRN